MLTKWPKYYQNTRMVHLILAGQARPAPNITPMQKKDKPGKNMLKGGRKNSLPVDTGRPAANFAPPLQKDVVTSYIVFWGGRKDSLPVVTGRRTSARSEPCPSFYIIDVLSGKGVFTIWAETSVPARCRPAPFLIYLY